MLPSTLKYLCSVEPVRMHFLTKQPCTNDTVCNAACSIAHSINRDTSRLVAAWRKSGILLSHAALHTVSIEILQGWWQHGEKVGYCYPSGLEKTLCKWDIYVLVITKGLIRMFGTAEVTL